MTSTECLKDAVGLEIAVPPLTQFDLTDIASHSNVIRTQRIFLRKIPPALVKTIGDLRPAMLLLGRIIMLLALAGVGQ